MNRTKPLIFLVSIVISLQLSGCSKKDTSAPKPAAQAPAQGFIDVVHDAVKVYASGGQTFQAPQGITIKTRKLSRSEGDRQVEYVEISGLKQKKESLAVIVFRFPASWLTVEKNKLAGLEIEKKDLKACAEKLQTKVESSNTVNDTNTSCRLAGISANGKQGIAIVDDKVKHIEMLTYSLQ